MKVGIAGLGAIGIKVASVLDAGEISGMHLTAVCSGSADKAHRRMKDFHEMPAIVTASELAQMCDIVVDCAPTVAFRDIAEAALGAGRVLVTVSGAAILDNTDLIDLARESGGRMILTTGALLGLDALRAAAEGQIYSVHMVTRKPPRSLAEAPYLREREIDVASFTEAKQVFSGTAAEGARGFPANVNVAAAVGLAGIGADKTTLEIWADPALERNTHTIVVVADSEGLDI